MNRITRLDASLKPRGTLPAQTFKYSEEVKKVLFPSGNINEPGLTMEELKRRAKNVVALESTIISHGMPYPENLECGISLETIVREQGAVPATIAILDGVIHIGLNPEDLKRLAVDGRKCAKCSRRDVALLTACGGTGATTVAATILLASMAGITVMATGGVGGVHRGGENSMDVSADLTELGQTPVMVVSAGIKSILDIGRTLEFLETQGVAVLAFQTKEFPAFFTRHSGCDAPSTLNSIQDGARFVNQIVNLNYTSGAVLAVPIPEQSEADGQEIQKAIFQALKEADEQKVAGRDITPFLLKRVNELTKGASLKANLALVRNNTKVASQIAALR